MSEPQTEHDALEERVRRLELTLDALRDLAVTFVASWNIHTPEGASLFDQEAPTCQEPMLERLATDEERKGLGL